MRIAICDDDKRLVVALSDAIHHWAIQSAEEITLSTFKSAESFLLHWDNVSQFDLLFLDIRMGEMNGMELAEVIRRTDKDMFIVFVTADRDFVFQSYDVDALHYLVKPITHNDVEKSLVKARDRLKKVETDAFIVSSDGRLIRKNFDDIRYFESAAHYIHLYTGEDNLRFRMNFSDLVSELASRHEFVRTHRSYLVNLKHITLVEDNNVTIEDTIKIPVSRSYRSDTYKAFVDYHANIRR